jgi:hypothetical protein
MRNKGVFMALESGLESKSIINLLSTKYDTASDAAAVAEKKSLSVSTSLIPATSAEDCGIPEFSIPLGLKNELNGLSEKLGVYKNMASTLAAPYLAKLGEYKDALGRDILPSSMCGLSIKNPKAALTRVLGNPDFKVSNLGTSVSLLVNKELDKLITIDTRNFITGAVGMAGMLSSANIAKIKSQLAEQLSLKGLDLKSRLDLKRLIADKIGLTSIDGVMNSNKTVSRYTNANTVNALLTIDPNLAARYLQEASNEANTGTTGLTNNDLLDAMVTTLKSPSDNNTETKLLLMTSVMKAIETNTTITDTEGNKVNTEMSLLSVATKNMTGVILDNIDSSTSNSTSTSPMSDFDNITKGLGLMDSGWNKDSDGIINYSSLKCNKRMVSLANKVASTVSIVPVLDGTEETIMTDYLEISILGAFCQEANTNVESRCSLIKIA